MKKQSLSSLIKKADKKVKEKKCKVCLTLFVPRNTLQAVCGMECAREYARISREKKEAKDARIYRKEAKEKLKDRREWIKDAQKAVNAYIRERDRGLPCISCGRPTKKGDHAGHWKPTSTSPELRFNELNIHLQCVQCNLHLHGNSSNYRSGLIHRIGEEKVIWLEGKQLPKRYTIDDLKAIKDEFVNKLKELKKSKSIIRES